MSRQHRIAVVLIIGLIILTTTIVYLEINNARRGILDVHVSALQKSITQGDNLTIMLNVSAHDIHQEFKIDGITYLKGIQLAYYGINKTSAEEGGPALEYGLAKYTLNSMSGSVRIQWNCTVVSGGLNYTLAPAGYYRLFEGGNIGVGTPSNTIVNFSVANQTISVYGTYGSVTSNHTNVSLAALPFGVSDHIPVSVYVNVTLNGNIIDKYTFGGTVPVYKNYTLVTSTQSNDYQTQIRINTPIGIILMVEKLGLRA
ncbi:hypothetical protein Thermo_02059 [Thermoplasmatales archaeon]|nr:hypothetical protein Thermo_02059 [Thermoplasmatales archaeon]